MIIWQNVSNITESISNNCDNCDTVLYYIKIYSMHHNVLYHNAFIPLSLVQKLIKEVEYTNQFGGRSPCLEKGSNSGVTSPPMTERPLLTQA